MPGFISAETAISEDEAGDSTFHLWEKWGNISDFENYAASPHDLKIIVRNKPHLARPNQFGTGIPRRLVSAGGSGELDIEGKVSDICGMQPPVPPLSAASTLSRISATARRGLIEWVAGPKPSLTGRVAIPGTMAVASLQMPLSPDKNTDGTESRAAQSALIVNSDTNSPFNLRTVSPRNVWASGFAPLPALL